VLVATGVLALLLLIAVAVAALTRLSLGRAFLVTGSAAVLLLTAITGNMVGGLGLELTVLPLTVLMRLAGESTASRRRRQAARHRRPHRARARPTRLAA
jgi:hypothetical protein